MKKILNMNFRQVKKLKVDLNDVIKRGYLTEQNVGITEFIGKHKPFHGILKHRSVLVLYN